MVRKNVILVYNDDYISKFNNEDELIMHFVQKKHKLRNINRNTIFVTSNKIYFIDADNCANSFNLVFKNKLNIKENEEIFFSNDVEKININNYSIFFDLALPEYLDSITIDDVDIEKEFSFRYISYYIGQNTEEDNAELIESLFPDNFFVTGMFAQRADTGEVSPLIHFGNFGSDFRFNRVDGCEKTKDVSYIDKEGVVLSWSHNGDHCPDRFDMYLYTDGGSNKYGFRPHNYRTWRWWWSWDYHYNEYMEWGDQHVLDLDRNNNPFDKRIIFFAIGKTLEAAPTEDEFETLQENAIEKYNRFKNITESVINDDSVDLFKDFPISKYLSYYYPLRQERVETDMISNSSASSKNLDLIYHKDDNMCYIRPKRDRLNSNVNDSYFNLPTDIVNKDISMLRFKMIVHEYDSSNNQAILSNYNCGNQILFDMSIDNNNKNKILLTYWDRTDGNNNVKYIEWIFKYDVKYDVVIKVDKPNNTLTLFVDGNKIGSITDEKINGNLSQNIRFFNWYSSCSNNNTSRADVEIADIVSFQTPLKDSKIPSFCKALINMSLLEKLTYNDEEFTLNGVDRCIGDFNFGRMKRIGRNGVNSLYGPIVLNDDGSVNTKDSALVFNSTKLLKVPFSFVGRVRRNQQVSSAGRTIIGLDVPHSTERPFFYFALRADGYQDQWFIHLGVNGTNYDSNKVTISNDYTGDINFVFNLNDTGVELILMDEDYKQIGRSTITGKQLLNPIDTNIGVGGVLCVRDDRGMVNLFEGSFKKLSVFNKNVSAEEAVCVLNNSYYNNTTKEEQYILDLRFNEPNLGLPKNIKPIVNNVTIKDGIADFGDELNTTNYIRIDNIKYFSEYTIYIRFNRSRINSSVDGLFSVWSPHSDNDIAIYTQGSKLRFESYIDGAIGTTQDFGLKTDEWVDVVITFYHDRFVMATKDKEYTVTISGSINYTYSENNVLTIGQEQDSKGGGFEFSQCFMGKIERVMYVEGAYTFNEVMSGNMPKKTVSRTKKTEMVLNADGYIRKLNGILVHTFNTRNMSTPNSKEEFDLLENKMTEDRFIGKGVANWINSSDYSSSLPSITDDYRTMFLNGYLIVPKTGNYAFAIDGDDAIDFTIYNNNNKEIFTLGWYGTHGRQGDNRHNKTVYLNKGEYRIKFRHNQGGGGLSRFLRWIRPGDIDYSNVPNESLYYIDEAKDNIAAVKPYMNIYPNIIAFFPLTNNSKSIIGNYESSYTGDNRMPLFTNKGAFFRDGYLDYSKYDFSKTKTILVTFTVVGNRGINNDWATIFGSKKTNKGNNILVAIYDNKIVNYHTGRKQILSDMIIRESNEYNMAIVEVENGVRNFYINGKLVAENIQDNNSLMDLATIGCDYPFNNAYNGYIKNVVLVDKPLDSSTIKKIQG